jgi:hypothetical protein
MSYVQNKTETNDHEQHTRTTTWIDEKRKLFSGSEALTKAVMSFVTSGHRLEASETRKPTTKLSLLASILKSKC